MQINPQDIKTFTGPNLLAGHQALIVCYSDGVFGNDLSLSPDQIQKLPALVPGFIHDNLSLDGAEDANGLLVALIRAFLDCKTSSGLAVEVKEQAKNNWSLIIEYHNEVTVKLAANASFLIISYVKSLLVEPPKNLLAQIQSMLPHLITCAISGSTKEMTCSAKKHGVPYYLIDNSTSLISYGQGSKAVAFDFAASEFNSNFGYNIQHDKVKTNAFLKKVGYPATDQVVVNSLKMCQQIINRMGFPVAIKPLSEGAARGVTASIQSMDRAIDAYNEASKYSPNNVLVEKHAVGGDYRLNVSNGKFDLLFCRNRPQIVGDGISPVRTLIEIENQRRMQPEELKKSTRQLDMQSDTLIKSLKAANYELHSMPQKSEIVYLGSTTNLASGGTYDELTQDDLHPDILEMAFDLCKLLRLDILGIDFITPDIMRSWSEMGTIIEVNAFPMVSKMLAKKYIGHHFSDNDGRIETTLVVSNDPEFSNVIFRENLDKSPMTGLVNNQFARFKNNNLLIKGEGFYSRCVALLLNPTCDALVVAMTPDAIISGGLPIDYFNQCIIDIKSNLTSDAINRSVQKFGHTEGLEEWLGNYVGRVENR